MKNLIRNCLYQGKNLFRNYSFSFWNLLYPLILSLFFYMAFSGLINYEIKGLGDITMGVEEGNRIIYILDQIQRIKIYEFSRDQAMDSLLKDEIDAFLDRDLNLLVNKSGIKQTIVKKIIEEVKQMQAFNRPFENFDFDVDYVMERDQRANGIMLSFYSLIAMVSTYGVFAGIMAVNFIQANLSSVGARINISPLKRSQFLLAGVIVALTLNLLSNGILLLFLRYILKIELFREFKYSSIFILLGNLFGISLGLFIGVSNKKNHNTKILMAIACTLALSFFSGMMGYQVKIFLDDKLPLLRALNPIGIITNNLYRINQIGSTKMAMEGAVVLSLYSVLLVFISLILLRRRNYDSL